MPQLYRTTSINEPIYKCHIYNQGSIISYAKQKFNNSKPP